MTDKTQETLTWDEVYKALHRGEELEALGYADYLLVRAINCLGYSADDKGRVTKALADIHKRWPIPGKRELVTASQLRSRIREGKTAANATAAFQAVVRLQAFFSWATTHPAAKGGEQKADTVLAFYERGIQELRLMVTRDKTFGTKAALLTAGATLEGLLFDLYHVSNSSRWHSFEGPSPFVQLLGGLRAGEHIPEKTLFISFNRLRDLTNEYRHNDRYPSIGEARNAIDTLSKLFEHAERRGFLVDCSKCNRQGIIVRFANILRRRDFEFEKCPKCGREINLETDSLGSEVRPLAFVQPGSVPRVKPGQETAKPPAAPSDHVSPPIVAPIELTKFLATIARKTPVPNYWICLILRQVDCATQLLLDNEVEGTFRFTIFTITGTFRVMVDISRRGIFALDHRSTPANETSIIAEEDVWEELFDGRVAPLELYESHKLEIDGDIETAVTMLQLVASV